MKKFLTAAVAAGLIFFGGQTQTEAADVEILSLQPIQTQEMSGWTRFRDKYILDRDRRDRRDRYRDDDYYYRRERDRRERERRERERRERERRYRDRDRYYDPYNPHDPPPPPPPSW